MANTLKRILVTAMLLALLTAPLTTSAAAETNPQKLTAYYELVVEYINRAQYDKALSGIEACLGYVDEETNPDMCADLHLKRGQVYLLTEEYDKALAELDEALRISPELSDAQILKTQAYSDMEQYEQALDALNAYVTTTGDATAYALQADIHAAMGDTRKAVDAFEKYVKELYESKTEREFFVARYQMLLGDYENAAAGFQRCLKDETYGVLSSYYLGSCQLNLSEFEKALKNLDRCVEAGEEIDGLYYDRARSYMGLGQYEQAEADLTISIDKESYKEDSYFKRGMCRMLLAKLTEAVADFTVNIGDAVEGGSINYSEALYYRGVCSIDLADYEAAIRDLTTCIDHQITLDDSIFYRGLAALLQGEAMVQAEVQSEDTPAASEASFTASVADFTANVTAGYNTDAALYYRALAYRYLSNNEAALADQTKCIENEYNLASSYYQRAQTNKAMGNEDAYIADLEESLKH